MLNNNSRYFGLYSHNKENLQNELSIYEFVQQYIEYIENERELDKFIIRGMAKYDILDLTIYSDRFSNFIEKNNIKLITGLNDKMYIDISQLDTSDITDLSQTFSYLDYFNQDISAWDVSSVTDMSWLFKNCSKFESDISKWNVSNVTDMSCMFFGSIIFNDSLNNWNVSNVIDMSYMFYRAKSFNNLLNRWDVSNVKSFDNMFGYTHEFKQYLADWSINTNVTKPKFDVLDFDEHNERYKFCKEYLDIIISKYENDKSDESKYHLIKYLKQYHAHNPIELSSFLKLIDNKEILNDGDIDVK